MSPTRMTPLTVILSELFPLDCFKCACFHRLGTLPEAREKLKRSVRGVDNGPESSFNNLLSIESGPAALPVLRVFRISSTS